MKKSRSQNKTPEPAVIKQFHWPDAAPDAAPVREQKAKRKGVARRPWSREEDAIIRKYYGKHGSRRTAQALKRTITSVQHRALKLGVPGHGIRPWTSKEEHYLRKYYGKRTAVEIARILKRSEQSVRGHIHQLGLGSYRPESWSVAEVTYLRKHYGSATVAQLAAELGRSVDAVELKAGKLGLRRKLVKLSPQQTAWIVANLGKISYDNMAKRLGVSSTTIMKIAAEHGHRPRPNIRPWTEQEDTYLRAHYQTKSRREIAEAIGRTIPLVGWRAAKLGLTKDSRNADNVRSWTAEEDAMLRRLLSETATYDAIADYLGRTRASVVGRAARLGLRRRTRSKRD